MRMKNRPTLRAIARLTLAVLLPCALAQACMAGELVQTVPSLGVSATALGLMLLTAASNDRK